MQYFHGDLCDVLVHCTCPRHHISVWKILVQEKRQKIKHDYTPKLFLYLGIPFLFRSEWFHSWIQLLARKTRRPLHNNVIKKKLKDTFLFIWKNKMTSSTRPSTTRWKHGKCFLPAGFLVFQDSVQRSLWILACIRQAYLSCGCNELLNEWEKVNKYNCYINWF